MHPVERAKVVRISFTTREIRDKNAAAFNNKSWQQVDLGEETLPNGTTIYVITAYPSPKK